MVGLEGVGWPVGVSQSHGRLLPVSAGLFLKLKIKYVHPPLSKVMTLISYISIYTKVVLETDSS